jgi:hypothetical protein
MVEHPFESRHVTNFKITFMFFSKIKRVCANMIQCLLFSGILQDLQLKITVDTGLKKNISVLKFGYKL